MKFKIHVEDVEFKLDEDMPIKVGVFDVESDVQLDEYVELMKSLNELALALTGQVK